jgi:hypothetical protein
MKEFFHCCLLDIARFFCPFAWRLKGEGVILVAAKLTGLAGFMLMGCVCVRLYVRKQGIVRYYRKPKL